MPKSSECKDYLCSKCNDPSCDHGCHQTNDEQKKLLSV